MVWADVAIKEPLKNPRGAQEHKSARRRSEGGQDVTCETFQRAAE